MCNMFSQKGPGQDELNPTISDDSATPQDGSLSYVQGENFVNTLSWHRETYETTDKCASGSVCVEMNSDSVLKDKMSGASFDDDDDDDEDDENDDDGNVKFRSFDFDLILGLPLFMMVINISAFLWNSSLIAGNLLQENSCCS